MRDLINSYKLLVENNYIMEENDDNGTDRIGNSRLHVDVSCKLLARSCSTEP